MGWKKIDVDNFVKREEMTVKKVKLSMLRKELQVLEAEVEPTKKELMDYALVNHPYYDPFRLRRIKELQELISHLEAL